MDSTPLWRLTEEFGARCYAGLEPEVTHLVALKVRESSSWLEQIWLVLTDTNRIAQNGAGGHRQGKECSRSRQC